MGAYSQRERHARSMEEDGQISFQYVENNGQPENMMRCVLLSSLQKEALKGRVLSSHSKSRLVLLKCMDVERLLVVVT